MHVNTCASSASFSRLRLFIDTYGCCFRGAGFVDSVGACVYTCYVHASTCTLCVCCVCVCVCVCVCMCVCLCALSIVRSYTRAQGMCSTDGTHMMFDDGDGVWVVVCGWSLQCVQMVPTTEPAQETVPPSAGVGRLPRSTTTPPPDSHTKHAYLVSGAGLEWAGLE